MAFKVLTDCKVATMQKGGSPYGMIGEAAIVMNGETIAWVGAAADLPMDYASAEVISLAGKLLTPALIDCHTHLVFGGDRAREFEMRLEGATYEEVARAGGGIVSTMRATREASAEELLSSALPRLDALIAEGVTTVEIKSGYGLNIDDEIKMLQVARQLEQERPIKIVTSWLAAHALPAEYKDRDDVFIDEIACEGLRQAHALGLVDAVDGFCEGIAFSVTQMERVFDVAKELGLPIKLHAEQLSNLGGAKMAAERGALSVDHIEYLDDDGVVAMAKSGTVASILPGAFYTIRETQLPPIQALHDAGVDIAIASDGNPGSSPLFSIILTMNMACTLFRLTPEEALAGVTRNAAKALGLQDSCGTIEPGKRADLAIWNIDHPAELSYRIGFNSLHKRVFGGLI
jgi:imidazolonepropionase